MARTHKMTALQAREQGIRFRRIVRHDEGFLVNYGDPGVPEGARRGRLTPNLAREYARTHEAIQEALMADHPTRTIEQEVEEDAALDARIERWMAEQREEEEDYAYSCRHDDYDAYLYGRDLTDWDEEERIWLEEAKQENHAWEVIHLMRTILRNPVLHG